MSPIKKRWLVLLSYIVTLPAFLMFAQNNKNPRRLGAGHVRDTAQYLHLLCHFRAELGLHERRRAQRRPRDGYTPL